MNNIFVKLECEISCFDTHIHVYKIHCKLGFTKTIENTRLVVIVDQLGIGNFGHV